MATDLMLDIETLGWHTDTVVCTLGAVKFNPYTLEEPHSGIYFRLDIDEQLNLGRSTDADTLEWWGQQPQEIREEALSEFNRQSIAQGLADLNKILVAWQCEYSQSTAQFGVRAQASVSTNRTQTF